jgi:uncharacterized sulfatase
MQSWVAKADSGDKHAMEYVDRHRNRPEVELYDVVNDPDNIHNLADDPKYFAVKASLRTHLDAWMSEQGDLGAETEISAETRLFKNRNR